MHSTHEAELNVPELPLQARRVYIVPELQSGILISIGQLCDSGCVATFTDTEVIITLGNKVILTGIRKGPHKLWTIDLSTPSPSPNQEEDVHQANATVLPSSAKAADIVAFMHAALFSPAISTLTTALDKGYVHNFPGLSSKTIRKHTPFSAAMIKGHQDQGRKNVQSTKPKPPKPSSDKDTATPTEPSNVDTPDDFFPNDYHTGKRTHFCYVAVHELTGQVYTDQTGKFIIPSSNGYNYIMILYDYDSNAIIAEPMMSRTAESILKAYQKIHTMLVKAGHRPKLQRLDNECSAILKDFMSAESVEYQLVPPHVHRRNAAERGIRTFQNHFIAGLCSVDKNFPLHLWCRLIPQANITLNLLRGSRINPKLSSWAQLCGTFDYNCTPIAPPGIRVLVHEPSTTRTTWSPHASDGWYVGPAMESYRCFQCWMWDTRAVRICPKVTWFPTKTAMPIATSDDVIAAAANDIKDALQNPTGTLHNRLGETKVKALKNLATILTNDNDEAKKELDHTPVVPPVPTAPKPSNTSTNRTSTVFELETMPKPAQPRQANVTLPGPTLPVIAEHAPSPRVSDEIDDIIADLEATYDNSTGHKGKKRRANKRRGKKRKKKGTPSTPMPSPAAPTPTTKAKQMLPPTTEPKPPRPVPEHHHFTRHSKNVQLQNEDVEQALTLQTIFPNKLTTDDSLSNLAFNEDGTVTMEFCNKALHPDTGKLAEYRELRTSSEGAEWDQAACEEIGRLAQGLPPEVPKEASNNTIRFIRKKDVPQGKTVTYLRVVAADRPQKAQSKRIRFTVGGNLLTYDGNASTRTSDLTTVKLHLNSVISTENGRYMTIDLKDFYLNTRLDTKEYMRIPVSLIPVRVMDTYNLWPLVHDGYVYVEIGGGMYGLSQAGIIANRELKRHLLTHGYFEAEHTHGLFKHKTRPIWFTLVVDDFGVGYVGKEHANHLVSVLSSRYTMSADWEGKLYCGITLEWDYVNRTVDLSMPDYVAKALQRFEHSFPKGNEDSPHQWQPPNYGAKQQLTDPIDTSRPLESKEVKFIQEVVGTFLWYARGVDSTMLVALGAISSAQAQGTEKTLDAVCQLLNYAASHPDAKLRYHASDMYLWAHSDASYLSEPKGRSRAGGHFYLSKRPANPNKAPTPEDPPPPHNGSVLDVSHLMKEVLASAAEAEFGGLFYNGKECCPIRTTLEELGHPQGPTPMATDNSTASGIANDTVKQRRSKAMDMRFYWVRDRVRQGHFLIYWSKGSGNLADYFTKHHSTSHHRAMRPVYLHNDPK